MSDHTIKDAFSLIQDLLRAEFGQAQPLSLMQQRIWRGLTGVGWATLKPQDDPMGPLSLQ